MDYQNLLAYLKEHEKPTSSVTDKSLLFCMYWNREIIAQDLDVAKQMALLKEHGYQVNVAIEQ